LILAALLYLSGSVVSRTPSDKEAFSPFTFAVVSDPQIGMAALERDRENFAKVVDAINLLKGDARPTVVFIAGDLIDKAGSPQQLAMFSQVKKNFSMPVYLVPGNHDLTTDGKRFDQRLLADYRTSVGPDKFTIEHAGCLFIGLNSQLWIESGQLGDEQFKWLERQLRNRSLYRYVFIVQHHPLYLTAANEKDQYFNTPLQWRLRLLRLFERTKVTIVLTGHLHRNLSAAYRGVAMITTPSTCRNFDGSAYGYRLITVTSDGFVEQYKGVPGTLPDPNPPKQDAR
jgi:3',5'-cyclic AMP phosphodiesterase CpdA